MSGALRAAWRRLGIDPTTDQGAIRRAYADALRAMDVDADVAGFSALREARDAVLAWARQQPADAPIAEVLPEQGPAEADAFVPGTWPHAAPRLDGLAGDGLVQAGTDDRHDALVPPLPLAPASGPSDPQFALRQPTLGVVEWFASDVDPVRLARPEQPRADHALHALLLEGPGTEFDLSEDERADAQAHVAALIAQADAGGVDLWGRTEEWLAETLARGWPRSAPLLGSVAHTFGWAGRPATTGDSPAVAFLIPRLGTQPLVRTVRPAEDALFVLLLPETGHKAPLTDAQEEEARQLLDTVLAEAHEGQVERSNAIETWLADVLAQAWPRSAPLLEPVAQAFNWESERGQLHERPAIAFLNARLRGLRFTEKVQDKGHPLHKAWVELTRDGSRKGLFVPKRQVRQLIDGVRTNFPELEQHFNPVLVAAWEGQGGGLGAKFGWIAIVVIGVIRMIIAISDYGQNHQVGAPAVTAPYEAGAPATPGQSAGADFDPVTDPALADVLHQMFGPAMTYPQVYKADAKLAAAIKANRRMLADPGELAHAGQVVLTQRFLQARPHAGPARLEALARWRLDMMLAAKADGPETCLSVYHWDDLPKGVQLTEAALGRQQALARAMLAAGELDPPPPSGYSRSYRIPGPMIDQIIRATGLSQAAVSAVFDGHGAPNTVCAVQTALIKAALGWKGPERTAILRNF